MDPLNKQERTEAILKMLTFFVVAVIIVAIPLYYAFRMPKMEQKFQKDKYDSLVVRLAEIDKLERSFLVETDSAISLFNAYQKEEDKLAQDKIQLRYSETTNKMEDQLGKIRNDTIKEQLYDNVIYIYDNLFSAWSDIFDLQDQLQECLKTNQNQSAEISRKSAIVKMEREKTVQEKEIDLINKALGKYNGSVRLAAKELGTTERKLRKRMKDLGIGD